jgi:DNA repair protein REV1
MAHADDLQAVSVDEALIDVSTCVENANTSTEDETMGVLPIKDHARDLAESIRQQVQDATGCTGRSVFALNSIRLHVLIADPAVSIGISHNIMLARLATRNAKPNGSYHLTQGDVADTLSPLSIDDLWGFGYSARRKAQEKLGTINLGDLMSIGRDQLCDALGRSSGETLFNALRGIDERKLESDKPRQSVSCDINVSSVPRALATSFSYGSRYSMASASRMNLRRRRLCIKLLKKLLEGWMQSLFEVVH